MEMKMLSCKEVLANLSTYVDREGSAELLLKILLDVEPFGLPVAASERLHAHIKEPLSVE